MSADENKALLRRMVDEVLNKKNLAVTDELVARDYVDHNTAPGQLPGIEAFRQARIARNAVFPDWHVTLEDCGQTR